MSKPKFVYVTYIAAAPEKIWQALTESQTQRQISVLDIMSSSRQAAA